MPIQNGVRKMRTWMLAEALVYYGHDVTWWSSTFSHQRKVLLAKQDTDINLDSRFRLCMIHAGQYQKNLSIARLVHHWRLGRGFARSVAKYPIPDVIVCAYPVIELAKEVAAYARANRIPLVIDVRDQWPSTYLLVCPRWLKPLVSLYVKHLLRVAKRIFSSATGLVAMSDGCLRWAQQIVRKVDRKDCVFHIGFIPQPNLAHEVQFAEQIEDLSAQLRGKVVFIYAGSFGAFYELSLIIDVARLCQNDELLKVHFVLAGDGEQLENLKKAAKGLTNVSFTGWLKSDDLNQLFKMAHVGLLPYLDFGDGTFPNKPAEYFAYGLPVISSIEGEFAEMVSRKALGINYQCGQKEDFYTAIKTMQESEDLLKKYSENALRVFVEQFDGQSIYLRYAKFIEEVVISADLRKV